MFFHLERFSQGAFSLICYPCRTVLKPKAKAKEAARPPTKPAKPAKGPEESTKPAKKAKAKAKSRVRKDN